MSELLPPEVPVETIEAPKREGFFKKLFSKKDEKTENTIISSEDIQIPELNLPDLNINSENVTLSHPANQLSDTLPELPPLEMEADSKTLKEPVMSVKPSKVLAKSRGKKPKEEKINYQQMDIHSSFDWTDQISKQNNYIKDSSRNNPDVNELINQANIQVQEQTALSQESSLMTQAEEVPKPEFESTTLPETHTELNNDLQNQQAEPGADIIPDMPTVNPQEQKLFDQIDKDHQKLRAKLEKKVESAPNRTEFIELMQKYDDRIEKRIEHKQMELSAKHNKLEKFHKTLTQKEKEIKNLYNYLKKLGTEVSTRQSQLNNIIQDNVNKQLAKRTVKEKKLLKNEVNKTIILNKQLQKKLELIEKDKSAFEKKNAQILTSERNHLTKQQQIYDKKLSELDTERKQFEERRRNAIDLLGRGDKIAKDLKDLQVLSSFVEKNKETLKKELEEDKELKDAIERAENKLLEDKQNIDKMIFTKYIESKLSMLTPGAIKPKDLELEFQSHKIYQMIKACKDLIKQQNIEGAKKAYNEIKRTFETERFDKIQKAMLYNTIRSLYNDVQIIMLKHQ